MRIQLRQTLHVDRQLIRVLWCCLSVSSQTSSPKRNDGGINDRVAPDKRRTVTHQCGLANVRRSAATVYDGTGDRLVQCVLDRRCNLRISCQWTVYPRKEQPSIGTER